MGMRKSVKRLVIPPEHARLPPIYPVAPMQPADKKSATNGQSVPSDSETEQLPFGFTIKPSTRKILVDMRGKQIDPLVIARKGYGALIYDKPVDLDSLFTEEERKRFFSGKKEDNYSECRKIFLRRLLGIEEGGRLETEGCVLVWNVKSITVYPEQDAEGDGEWRVEKPEAGIGLNAAATIQLEGCYPVTASNVSAKDPVVMQAFLARLKNIPGTTFVDYIQDGGIWVFHVDHF
jgi:hypothetical protein